MRVEWSLLIIPVTCMPSKAKMRMKRKRRKRRERMERIELRREITRFLRLAQYLVTWKEARCSLFMFVRSQIVTLKILKSLSARRTERPNCPASGLVTETKTITLSNLFFFLQATWSNLTQCWMIERSFAFHPIWKRIIEMEMPHICIMFGNTVIRSELLWIIKKLWCWA